MEGDQGSSLSRIRFLVVTPTTSGLPLIHLNDPSPAPGHWPKPHPHTWAQSGHSTHFGEPCGNAGPPVQEDPEVGLPPPRRIRSRLLGIAGEKDLSVPAGTDLVTAAMRRRADSDRAQSPRLPGTQ